MQLGVGLFDERYPCFLSSRIRLVNTFFQQKRTSIRSLPAICRSKGLYCPSSLPSHICLGRFCTACAPEKCFQLSSGRCCVVIGTYSVCEVCPAGNPYEKKTKSWELVECRFIWEMGLTHSSIITSTHPESLQKIKPYMPTFSSLCQIESSILAFSQSHGISVEN